MIESKRVGRGAEDEDEVSVSRVKKELLGRILETRDTEEVRRLAEAFAALNR